MVQVCLVEDAVELLRRHDAAEGCEEFAQTLTCDKA
eukprot:CAMPEP_0115423730 /NCGR_PEP_ID=MMETSP0271-20121206/27463_1 /TAXON_ID=71861 /ORGANISM="Scrippsiella trochoidea, Strain CCMP3099" /LENGTH=35 /DNA_ID= /DNA_START= /DNA_END= /DNA_ORIENTATION=